MQELELRSTNLARQFSLGLVPALNSIAGPCDHQPIRRAARDAGEAFGTLITWVAKGVTGAWTAVELLGKSIGLLIAVLERLKPFDGRGALAAMKEGMADISQTAADAGEMIRKMGEETQKLPAPKHSAAAGGRHCPCRCARQRPPLRQPAGWRSGDGPARRVAGGGASFAPAASGAVRRAAYRAWWSARRA
jgi:hypothetical protein